MRAEGGATVGDKRMIVAIAALQFHPFERLTMQVRVVADAPASARAEALVVPVFSGAPLDGVAKTIDGELGGSIGEVLSSGEIKGKLSELALVHAHDKSYKRVLLVGLGDSAKFEPWMLARLAGAAVRYLGRRNIRDLAFALPPQAKGNEAACASFLVEGAIAGGFDTSLYQKDPEKRSGANSFTLLGQGFDEAALGRGVERGEVLGEAVNFARRLAITPANDMTPTDLADEATKAAKETGLEIDVLDEDRCREEGMGSFLSVAQGSAQPPKFIVLTYKGDPGSTELLALVGKGITFDTGGISIKPAERMEEMKYDMSGGAAVIAVMRAIGQLKPKLNVVGIVPATENMPGGKATKPGDVFTAMNGKTIEVINTDAEGRLILADALCYANKLGATKIVDAATLTGACVIALGHAASAAVSNNEEFVQQFLAAAKPSGERYWQMPLYEDYSNQMRSDIADLKNTGGRPAGTLTAAAFLKSFVDDKPWIHLDVAGTAYLDSESAWQAKGPTGTPVRAFISLVEQLAGSPTVHANGTRAAVGV
jgi:leucyl aminopeptidase